MKKGENPTADLKSTATDRTTAKDGTVNDRECCLIEEFSAKFGIFQSTSRRRIRDGSLPFFQPGGPGTRILIPKDALTRKTIAGTSASFESCAANSSPSPATRSSSGLTPKWRRSLNHS